MTFDPKNISNSEDAQRYMANARRLGNDEAYRAGFRRYCELKGCKMKPSIHGKTLMTTNVIKLLDGASAFVMPGLVPGIHAVT